MKKSRFLSPLAVATFAVAGLNSGCGAAAPTTVPMNASTPSNNDAGAASWRMIYLSGPTQFAVAAPAAPTSDAYRAELEAIKTAQAGLTKAQKETIEYWSAGGVVRWNQIILEMVAKADLPPAPLPNGTYPAPDVENPFADPQYPFSNPPYSARAHSYVSVAQFEALKVAWYYKYLYGRPSPSRVDSGVQTLMPTTDLPAYPSEDAVVSGVSAELLKLLFPTSVEEITRRAADQRNAALWSGRSSSSDITVGLALGKAVAAVFATRASGDGMRAAGGNAALWQSLANAATARGEIPWKSLETPARPPMLPLFGQVTAWMMTPTEILNERPGPPPPTSSALMKQELAEVKTVADNLTRKQIGIAWKWADGASTYTPPGHWSYLATNYVSNAHWSEVRAARAFALLEMALHDAAVACWDAKYAYYNPRPSQLDPSIKTVVGIPNFPAYTSGHSTFSAAAASVLSYLFPSGATEFNAAKDEAAISRLYGGIHYRADIEVGKDHGTRVGGYTIRFAKADGADPR